MRTVAIVQARMGSTRLPGKVLIEVGGRPVLAHVIARARAARTLDAVVVATTDTAEDAAVIAAAEALGVAVFAGSRDDVLDRTLRAALAHGADVVVRLTADCPLLDPALIDRLVRRFQGEPKLDYLATGGTFPEGYGVEVFSLAALRQAAADARLASEREHVTPYIWKRPGRFAVERYELQHDLSRYRLCVDEAIDLEVVAALVAALAPEDPLFGLGPATAYLAEHPEIAALNAGIRRQAGYHRSVAHDLAEEPADHA